MESPTLYVSAVNRLRWLLDLIEEWLRVETDGAVVSSDNLNRRCQGRVASEDQMLVALSALSAIGLLVREGNSLIFRKSAYEATSGFRSGVRVGCDWSAAENKAGGTARVCAVVPPGIGPDFAKAIGDCADDLRGVILDVIASARRTLIVASPFWDFSTAAELLELVGRRLDAGVEVTLLGRFESHMDGATRRKFQEVSDVPNCSVMSWFNDVGTGVETFHFKAASADGGRKAYVGSANLTASSLRSRMELGLMVTGAAGIQVDSILRIALSLSTPIRFSQAGS